MKSDIQNRYDIALDFIKKVEEKKAIIEELITVQEMIEDCIKALMEHPVAKQSNIISLNLKLNHSSPQVNLADHVGESFFKGLIDTIEGNIWDLRQEVINDVLK